MSFQQGFVWFLTGLFFGAGFEIARGVLAWIAGIISSSRKSQ